MSDVECPLFAGARQNSHPFQLDCDTNHIVIEMAEGEKKLLTLSEGVAHALAKHGVPDIGLQFHELTPKMQSNSDGLSEVARMRYNVKVLSKSTVFHPTALNDQALLKTEHKHAEFGLCWHGCFEKLPTSHCKIVWDCCISEAPPAVIKPVKPKLWLVKTLTLQPGKYYCLQ